MRTLNLTVGATALLSSAAAGALLALSGACAFAKSPNVGTLSLLPTLPNPGHAFSSARAISGNGQTVVGVSSFPGTYDGPDGFHAVFWDSQLSLRFTV